MPCRPILASSTKLAIESSTFCAAMSRAHERGEKKRERGLKDGGGVREGGTDRHDFIAANWWRGSTRERSDGPTKNVGP